MMGDIEDEFGEIIAVTYGCGYVQDTEVIDVVIEI